ncbi:hypothetical protein [Nocardia sp.]|uniref:hypothetical protein n=1 Tax=Nocardia sp. TaxID=1821 RepID=UPI00261DA558|nr:hypothetical protein [Nocardia sp.]
MLRLHIETACRRGGAPALRPHDLDEDQCLVLLREKGQTERWQPISPTLMRHLLAHAFAEFLRQRLERDHPEQVAELHHITSDWLGSHQMLSEAIDHAMAAGDPERAVELVEENARDLVEHGQLATLTGLAAKLPPRHAAAHPLLQITLAWANVLLRRPAEVHTALRLAIASDTAKSAAGQPMSDLELEAALLHGVEFAFADRIDDRDSVVEECRSRTDALTPWVLCAASNVGAFVALHRFDFDRVREWHEWGAPYFRHVASALSIMYSHCLAGIAAHEQLDMDRAEHHFQTALQLARTTAGENSQTARLAGAMLGDFRYERNELEEAELLLDNGAQLGFEGGPVDLLLATYATGARIKAVRGDLAAAVARLTEGARVAGTLALPRLAARIVTERVRLGLEQVTAADRQRAPIPENNGIITAIRESEEESAIRTLLRGHPDLAAARSAALLRSIDPGRRPRAALYATLLNANCLATQGHTDDAADELAPVPARCAHIGIVRPVLDEGPTLIGVIRRMRNDQEQGRQRPARPHVPRAFLAELLDQPAGELQNHGTGLTSPIEGP